MSEFLDDGCGTLLNLPLQIVSRAIWGVFNSRYLPSPGQSLYFTFSLSDIALTKDVVQLTNVFLKNKFPQKCKDYLPYCEDFPAVNYIVRFLCIHYLAERRK